MQDMRIAPAIGNEVEWPMPEIDSINSFACICINSKIIIIKLLVINEIQVIVWTWYQAFITLHKSEVIEILTS